MNSVWETGRRSPHIRLSDSSSDGGPVGLVGLADRGAAGRCTWLACTSFLRKVQASWGCRAGGLSPHSGNSPARKSSPVCGLDRARYFLNAGRAGFPWILNWLSNPFDNFFMRKVLARCRAICIRNCTLGSLVGTRISGAQICSPRTPLLFRPWPVCFKAGLTSSFGLLAERGIVLSKWVITWLKVSYVGYNQAY